ARRVAQPHLAAAHGLARRDQRAGADEAVLLHYGAVEHDRAHADQAGIGDAAGVDDRLVADGDVLADHRGEPAQLGVRSVVADVDDGAVLDVGARAHADELDVAAHDDAGPERHVVAEHDVADQGGYGIDVDALAEGGQHAAIGARFHAL